jgi:CBS domain-containing protein
MNVLKLCGRHVSTVPVLATVAEAVQLMIENVVGAVAVVDDEGIVAGMFTERDVLEKFALSGRDPRQTPVRELMSPMVEMATEETTPAEALRVMLERHYRHMPVVDERGRVLGILSIRHILENRIDDLLRQLEDKAQTAAGER